MKQAEPRSEVKISINKGIPIPERTSPSGRTSRYPWADMEVGDSFDTGTKKSNGAASSGNKWAKKNRLDRKFLQRTMNGTVHVWRIK